jgi:hypothetical protein
MLAVYRQKRIHPLTKDTARISSSHTVFVCNLFCNQKKKKTAIGSWLQKKKGKKMFSQQSINKMGHLCLWLCFVSLFNERESKPAARRIRPRL